MADQCLLRKMTVCKNINGGRDEINCAKCHFHGFKEDKQREILEKIQVTQSLIPEGLDDLQNSEKCVFCAGEHKNDPALYAQYCMGHVKPESKKPAFFGFGETDAPVGSFITVSFPICKECRKKARFGRRDLLKEVDILQQMGEIGWFHIGQKSTKTTAPSVIFTRKKPHNQYEAKNNG